MLKSVSSITNSVGALNFKGTWDANANSPVITSSAGTKGDYYVVGTAGATNLNGTSNWGVGDLATFNGSVWQRVEGGADLNGVNLSVSGTSTLSNLTASTALALNASKEIVSVTNTGTGNNVLATTPTLTTPILGAATATSVNKVAITAPATSATLTIADGKTLTASNTLTFTGTDSSSVAFGAGGTAAYTANKLSAFAATTSAELAGVISDETGSGALVFATSPTFVTPILGAATGTSVDVTGLSKALNFQLDAVDASNYDIKMVRTSGDGGNNTSQVYWNAAFGAGAAGGCLGAYNRSGTYSAPGSVISGSNEWTIYGFIGVAP